MIPDFLTGIICIFAGKLYPAYCTFKALKNKQKNVFSQWLMYWVCFALFATSEFFADILLGFWLPFYNVIKIGFLCALVFNQASGAKWFYTNFILNRLMENETLIDTYMIQTKDFMVRISTVAFNEVFSRSQILARQMVAQMQQLILQQLQSQLPVGGNFLMTEERQRDEVDFGENHLISERIVRQFSQSTSEDDEVQIIEDCDHFTIIKEEDGVYKLVPEEEIETYTVQPPQRRRGRSRRCKEQLDYSVKGQMKMETNR